MYEQEWLAEVNNHSHCKIYRIFKQRLNFENYLVNLSPPGSVNLCKYRCSNTNIPSISGRYQNLDLHERVCILCPNNQIGDEFHYIFECPFFSNERSRYLKKHFRTRASAFKMGILFQSKSKVVLRNLGYFCSKIIDKFR